MDEIKDLNLVEFTDDLTEFNEVNPSKVYMVIPSEYVDVYYKLMLLMADLGKIVIDDCSSICKSDNKQILSCWTLFNSAISCYNLGDIKKANLFIDYIRKQLIDIYKGRQDVNLITTPIPITENGFIRAIINFDKETKYYLANGGTPLPEGYDYVYRLSYNNILERVYTSDGKYVIYKK